MANGYFERGEVYWVRVDTGLGTETGIGRPGLIVSNNVRNTADDTVNILWLTTQPKTNPWDILTYATGKRSFVLCNQGATVDKTRLGKCIGELPPDDMRKVDAALEDQFDLGYTDDAALKEKETEIRALNVQMDELRAEIAKLKSEIAGHADADAATRVEIEMWQRLYGKALDQVVSMKLDGDVARRVVRTPEPSVEQPKVEKKPEPPKESERTDGLVDVNSASFKELKSCGFSNNLVLTIIDKRPYKSIDDVKKLPGVTNVMWQIVSKKICCKVVEQSVKDDESTLVVPEEPVVVEEPVVAEPKPEKPKKEKVVWDGVKVNINSDIGIFELMKRTGMNQRTASDIVRHRDQFGDYEKIEDLLNLQHFGNTCMKRYGHMLEV